MEQVVSIDQRRRQIHIGTCTPFPMLELMLYMQETWLNDDFLDDKAMSNKSISSTVEDDPNLII